MSKLIAAACAFLFSAGLSANTAETDSSTSWEAPVENEEELEQEQSKDAEWDNPALDPYRPDVTDPYNTRPSGEPSAPAGVK